MKVSDIKSNIEKILDNNKAQNITSIDLDWETEVIVVRTDKETNYEDKMQKKIRTSGCAIGTMFSDVMDSFDCVKLNKNAIFHTSWLHPLLKEINTQPSLYLEAGAIHSCVLCKDNNPLVYIEDVGRHNALDKLIGSILKNNQLDVKTQFITCSGRLNFELVQKVLMTNIGIMIGVGAPTSLAIDLANKFDMTLIGFVKKDSFNIYTKNKKVIID